MLIIHIKNCNVLYIYNVLEDIRECTVWDLSVCLNFYAHSSNFGDEAVTKKTRIQLSFVAKKKKNVKNILDM